MGEIKLRRVKRQEYGKGGVPYIVTHDGRTIRYHDPAIKVHDTIKYNVVTSKIEDYVKFDVGNVCFVTAGNNMGRVGVVVNCERHPGSFDIVHVKDKAGHS